MRLVGSVRRIVAMLSVLAATVVVARAEDVNDYPTSARAEYVYGCMKANGETRQAIEQCSCSVDVIASILPYQKYESAETILSMRQGIGQAANAFRSTAMYDEIVADLRRAQAEAEMRCFP